MNLSIKAALKITKVGFFVLKKAYQENNKARATHFLQCVETRYELMSLEEKVMFENLFNSKEGQEILQNYVDTITKTRSNIVRMALALLFCRDKDYSFTAGEEIVIVDSLLGVSDQTLDFFLTASSIKPLTFDWVYPVCVITENNYQLYFGTEILPEQIFVMAEELNRRKLLLPDPRPKNSPSFGQIKEWYITFGVSNTTLKIASLIRKATLLTNET